MYKKAIKKNSNFIVPFIEGIKYFDSDEIEHALATMIIVNKKGDIITCKHVANEFVINKELENNYDNLLEELDNNRDAAIKKYNLEKNTIVLNNISLPFKLKGVTFDNKNYQIFSKKLPEQGQSVCKLGFAFPEYSYFEYSKKDKKIVLKKDMVSNFPFFPMDGIVTRHVVDDNNNLSMFETSTPGLRGQSGGPVFSPDGIVYGIQSMTKHIDLNFDVDADVKRGSNTKHVTFTPFINLGVAISSCEIIKFLDENNVEYQSQ